ncbi:methionyl-tRNA formyltransferase [Marinifilum fragile]|uniref:methionyl-tRNA formyltransferase n=1 Tax=Marinifilum fragile TaxID=570161 RepID=UPI002AA61613|nr:methionyl-tRNA formyltransferase [Marinifilum fragile]
MRVAVIGAVSSTLITLKKLHQYGFDIHVVFGQKPDNPSKVSGLVDMESFCNDNNIRYIPFKRINDLENITLLKKLELDVIFALGFSQLVSDEILSIPKFGCIGFHPTKLPKGRGRAPSVWLLLEEEVGAATFFLMGKGMDDGPIFVQEEFKVLDKDNSESLRLKLLDALDLALDKWLPKLKNGIWEPIPQDENLASYYGKRNPLDGWISWERNVIEIDRLIRATSKPYPGAFTFYKDSKLIVWNSSIEKNLKIKGVIGRILLIKDGSLLVQTGEGLLWINDYDLQLPNGEMIQNPNFKVGEKLGYNVEYEIYKLKNNISI